MLNVLGTDPRYRRRGGAAMLVEWGLKRADGKEKRILSILEQREERLCIEDVGL